MPLITLAGWRPVGDERSPDLGLEDDLSELRLSIERRTEQVSERGRPTEERAGTALSSMDATGRRGGRVEGGARAAKSVGEGGSLFLLLKETSARVTEGTGEGELRGSEREGRGLTMDQLLRPVYLEEAGT